MGGVKKTPFWCNIAVRTAHMDSFSSLGRKFASALHATKVAVLREAMCMMESHWQTVNDGLIKHDVTQSGMKFNGVKFIFPLRYCMHDSFPDEFLPIPTMMQDEILPLQKMVGWIFQM